MRLIIYIFIILYLNICNMFVTLNYKLLVIRLLYFNDLGPIRILIMYSMICKLFDCDIIFLHNHIYHSSHVCNHVSFSARTFLLLNIFMHFYNVIGCPEFECVIHALLMVSTLVFFSGDFGGRFVWGEHQSRR